jgi:hypothetical protein
MNCYLYGIIESDKTKNLGPIGFELGGRGKGSVAALSNQNLAAVIGPAPQESFGGLSKERLVKALLAHQETLETIMKIQFILPCKFGTVLKDEQEVNEILSQSGALLEEWLNKMKNRCEMDVLATWDTQAILKEIAARDPEIVELKRHLQSLPLAEQQSKKLSLGMLLSAKLKENAKRYAGEIQTALKEASESYATHDVMNDEMVFNASFLLARDGEDFFFKALEGLDQEWQGKLNFKCVGPLPPYSFATVTIKRFDSKQIHWAQEILGLKGSVDVDQVKRAYKNRARQCHPDTHSELNKKEFEAVHQAYQLLSEYYQGGCKPMKVSLLNVNGDTG